MVRDTNFLYIANEPMLYKIIVNNILSFVIIGDQRLHVQWEEAPDDGRNSAPNMYSSEQVNKF
jgi:hypothetical protein